MAVEQFEKADKPHVFVDISDLHQELAACMVHDQSCKVPSGSDGPHIAFMSSSCKELSKLRKGWHLRAEVLTDTTQSTG